MRAWLWAWMAFTSAHAQLRVAPTPVKPITVSPSIPPETAVALAGLAGRAGVIFVGRVLSVEHHDDAGFVDVVFLIDTAVRGCSVGSRYTLREWVGLWAGWPSRYGVGQKLLMMLAPRGPSGMSAPVGGMAGMIPVVGSRQPPLVRGNGVAPAESASELTEDAVDLRWVEAAAQRSTVAVPQGLKASGTWRGAVVKMPVLTPSSAAPGVGLSAVLFLLGAGRAR